MNTESIQEGAAAPEDTYQEGDDTHSQIEALKAELEQVKAQSLIERADLENQRKRMERDVRTARLFANKQLLGDLLPVFDGLEAALAAIKDEGPLRDGVLLTLRELTRISSNNGLIEVAPKRGEAFNPEHHQAMSAIETEAVAPGQVFDTFQKGYLLNEQLLRPALVAVAKHD